jgi:hypothetical protein
LFLLQQRQKSGSFGFMGFQALAYTFLGGALAFEGHEALIDKHGRRIIRVPAHRRQRTIAEFEATRKGRVKKEYDQDGGPFFRGLSTEGSPTDANIAVGYGTHHSWIWVGTPPQRFSLILDTGSYYTSFPCEQCTQCEDYEAYHESGPYISSESTTFTQPVMPISGAPAVWEAVYHEGNGWKAYVSSDMVCTSDFYRELISLHKTLNGS